jgi:DNA polymerase I - 3''-5'' exonuclease and polymerase domains
MIAVDSWLRSSGLHTKMIMQVHDELVFEVPEAELATVRSQVTALMTAAAQLAVPLLVESGVGDNWDEAH